LRRLLIRRVLRYAPNPVRDEWVNIGVLVFDSESGERRLRLVEEEDEFHRVRRLHPDADESVLPRLRDTLESLFTAEGRVRDWRSGGGLEWLTQLDKLDKVLSTALQVTEPVGTRATDLDAELERLYRDHVAVPRAAPVSREVAVIFARTARRFSSKLACGTAWRSPFARRSLLFRAIPCA